jgi:hypothetical protein
VGVGNVAPAFKLDVDGVVNATEYRMFGVPLSDMISSDTFWRLENPPDQTRLYYDEGFVGIGTSAPSNMLELSASDNAAAITFDINNENLYTMGVDVGNEEAFIISRGDDLSVPLFVFKNENIGIGITNPQANVHVSGNLGVIFEGQFTGDNLAHIGSGTRMMWYPGKAAFRAGKVSGGLWDGDDLGDYSVGLGMNPLAKGEYSAVLGGFNGVAEGVGAVAIGGIQNEPS